MRTVQILNQNGVAANALSPLHFLFYDVKVDNTSMRKVDFNTRVTQIETSMLLISFAFSECPGDFLFCV